MTGVNMLDLWQRYKQFEITFLRGFSARVLDNHSIKPTASGGVPSILLIMEILSKNSGACLPGRHPYDATTSHR
jgi:hypothetical protein